MRLSIARKALTMLATGAMLTAGASARTSATTGSCDEGKSWVVVITVDGDGRVTGREGITCSGDHWIGRCDDRPLQPDAPASTLPYFSQTTCKNGFEDAYVITQVDGALGCVTACHGVDRGGAHFSYTASRRPTISHPGSKYDIIYNGVIDGHAWYAKISLNDKGEVAKVWGAQADGTFYEIISQSTRTTLR